MNRSSMRNTFLPGAILLALAVSTSCTREPRIPDETYLEAVARFHTALAAMQTSQDVLARDHLQRVTEIVPSEPAAWANLGLLLLRQQQTDEALQRLTRAAELAPEHAQIARLLALAESQKGNVDASIRYWRRAMELDPADVKAPFALAQELERKADDANEAEALRILGTLVDRSGNLAAQLEYARLAAKRNDAAALRKALDALTERSRGWPADAQARLATAREAAARNPADAATPLIFVRNVLIRAPEFRAAYAAVTTPRSEVGEPLLQFVALRNPDPRPAPPDEQLTFSIAQTEPGFASPGATWAAAVPLTADGEATFLVANGRQVWVGLGATRLPFPGGPDASPPGPNGVVPADLNYDFRVDLAFAGVGGLRIFRQDAKGGFTDVTAAAKLPADIASGVLHGAWAADIDTDGDLDLLVSRSDGAAAMLRNNGDGTFAVQSPFGDTARVRGFVWADLDGEGVPDAVLLNDQGVVRTFLNLRGGEFRERPVPAAFRGVVAMAAAEATGDAVMDLLGVTGDGAVLRLSAAANEANAWNASELARVDVPAGFSVGTGRLLVADLDNNAAPDLVASSASATRVLLRGPDAAFRRLSQSLSLGATAAADVDTDGRLDLVAPGDAGARVARSQGQRQYHWQIIRPRATTATGDQRINSFGIGGEVEVRTGLHAQKQIISSPIVHFGLGEATRAEVARISWPNGVLQSEFDLSADTAILASQRLKGSCPWLFAWNGREVGFVTDFIWRSPLGLRINAQATADVLMTEEWVKLRGDQLVAKDGAYDLRVTAELWETHFFDLVSLLVLDHPADTEVFVDERFAVPPPKLAAIATGAVQEFSSVRDDRGRDVREIVRSRDDRHLDFAGRGAYQGVTRDHYIEIELPDAAPRDGPLWLIGQGWIHPTDSSVNVALGQGSHAPPTGLSLHVADAHGRFTLARGGLGFPAGKDKTILIDLAGVLPVQGPRRFRLQTNLEIFWDRLGWAIGRPDVKLETRRIELTSADLRYRGFSVTEQKDASTPERPRYALEGTAPRWRDLEGFHTRFGDVRELLLNVDDRYVIMNAGDELVMRFPEAPPPAAGMVRDFVVIGDGWEKDGDYNTTASRTVLPLPTHRSAKYGAAAERLEDDPVYLRQRGDFERYHTRYVSPEAARDALRVRIDPRP
jgi:Tfp pilus assembly protein PilF